MVNAPARLCAASQKAAKQENLYLAWRRERFCAAVTALPATAHLFFRALLWYLAATACGCPITPARIGRGCVNAAWRQHACRAALAWKRCACRISHLQRHRAPPSTCLLPEGTLIIEKNITPRAAHAAVWEHRACASPVATGGAGWHAALHNLALARGASVRLRAAVWALLERWRAARIRHKASRGEAEGARCASRCARLVHVALAHFLRDVTWYLRAEGLSAPLLHGLFAPFASRCCASLSSCLFSAVKAGRALPRVNTAADAGASALRRRRRACYAPRLPRDAACDAAQVRMRPTVLLPAHAPCLGVHLRVSWEERRRIICCASTRAWKLFLSFARVSHILLRASPSYKRALPPLRAFGAWCRWRRRGSRAAVRRARCRLYYLLAAISAGRGGGVTSSTSRCGASANAPRSRALPLARPSAGGRLVCAALLSGQAIFC